MGVTAFATERGIVTQGSGASVVFPDVCKTPGLGIGPSVPIPYPTIQLQENLQQANKVDAKAKAGDPAAKRLQKQAIDNLRTHAGVVAPSATAAVLIGRSVHKKSAADEAATARGTVSHRAPSRVRSRVNF